MFSLRWLLIVLNVIAVAVAVYLLRQAEGMAAILVTLGALIYALLNLAHVILVHRGSRVLGPDNF